MKLGSVLISNSYMSNDFDRCVYNKLHDRKDVTSCIYVDEMIILDTSPDTVKSTKRFLMSTLTLKT